MTLLEMLTHAIYWAGLLSLAAIALAILVSMLTSSVPWSDLLSDVAGAGSPGLVRTGFLFGNIGLAVIFLLSIVQFSPDEAGIERLREATNLVDLLDMSAVTGTASAAYLWSKLSSR